ncbi:MAG: fumarate hydratase subunit alpha [Eubacteriales bacterium]|nr:fumarate hydratase subunit alpha [Eubacteriales bacterium]
MRKIGWEKIKETVKILCQQSNFCLRDDVLRALRAAQEKEISPAGREVLAQLVENAAVASEEKIPLCQDTGLVTVFIELGQDVCIEGGFLYDAVQEGVREGYLEGYLRKSVVADPIRRTNTGDNTPAIIYTRLVPGDRLRITVMPKGGGSENMSALKMLKPADGLEGMISFVLETVEKAGPNPCPPIVVGVGVGGDFALAAHLAKKALLRPVGTKNPDPFWAGVEEDLLAKINSLGIGPAGFGGRITALAVHIETHPTHIACLPVAVNISCHATRSAEAIL